jgi:hypothetical protein
MKNMEYNPYLREDREGVFIRTRQKIRRAANGGIPFSREQVFVYSLYKSHICNKQMNT